MTVIKLCLETLNYKGERVIFTKRQRFLKSAKHPELRDDDFIHGRLKKTIETPKFVYQDFSLPKKRQAYYFEEYRIDGKARYTKVCLEIRSNHLFVITGYRPDYVKERGKTKLLYGKDDE